MEIYFAKGQMPNHSFGVDGKNFEFYNGVYYYQISELNQGQSFGELALLSSDSKRAATVKCQTQVIFATLDKRNFERSLNKIEARKNAKFI